MNANTRNTRQKRHLRQALHSQTQPGTAEDLHMWLANSGAKMSLSTVYRNLDRMATTGEARRLTVLGDKRARYELAGNGHHHHVVCRSCNRVEPFDACPLDRHVETLEKQTGYTFDDHTLEISGLCADCRQRANS